jgi:hypothetical protein
LREVVARAEQEIDLGKQGENLAVRVVFDIGSWRTTYGNGVVQLVFKRNGDKYPYPCAITVDGGKVYWDITNTETNIVGRGSAELRYLSGNVVVKSVIYNTRVIPSMTVTGETPPEPAKNWMDRLLELAASVQGNISANALAAQIAAESALASAESAEKSAREVKNLATNILAREYCTKYEAQQYANTAESNAKNYADAQIAEAIGVAIGGNY